MPIRRALQIGLIGARRRLILHDRTEQALQHAAEAIGAERGAALHFIPRWLAYDELQWDVERALRGCDAVIAPPCDAAGWEDLALEALQVARVLRMPLLAMGGGFELALREQVQNVLGQNSFESRERGFGEPGAASVAGTTAVRRPLVMRAGAGRDADVELVPGTRLGDCHARSRVREVFFDAAGLEPSLEDRLQAMGLRTAARRVDGTACALELVGRMFHVLVAYAPQLTSSRAHPHPAFRGLLEAALAQTEPSPAGATPLRARPQ